MGLEYSLYFWWIDQSKLGVSMKVERSSVSSVKERIEALKRKKEEPESNREYGKLTFFTYNNHGLNFCIFNILLFFIFY